MINFNYITEQRWAQERAYQPFKKLNVAYIQKLNSKIKEAIIDLDHLNCSIFYKNDDKDDNITGNYFYYNYGSPAPYLCKFLPEGYGFLNFYPNNIYKKVSPNYSLRSALLDLYNKGKFTRYIQPRLPSYVQLPDNFILVTMQNTGPTVWYKKNFTDLANEIVAWSKENKKHVIFKWHNGCLDHSNPDRWFEELKEKSDYSSIEYRLPLNVLIKNCKMMWTASSMSGIEALINNKPVAVFGKTEYMEMSTVSNSPEEAITATVPNDLDQWLTYYVNYYCINILSKNSVNRLKTRIINYVDRGMTLDEIIIS